MKWYLLEKEKPQIENVQILFTDGFQIGVNWYRHYQIWCPTITHWAYVNEMKLPVKKQRIPADIDTYTLIYLTLDKK